MNKDELRIKYKTLRDNLSIDEIDNLSLDIANQALRLPIWDKTNYHLFLSIQNKKEIDT
ncbi:MAG: 5-formyltetrahydrofolate cyclo-ligase, partial [Flavobacterium sp.]